jgi:GIY-YIG catalytic domain
VPVRLRVRSPDAYRIGAFFMATVYILRSEKLNRFYVGSCDSLEYRIDQHLNKEFVKSFTTSAEDYLRLKLIQPGIARNLPKLLMQELMLLLIFSR